MEEIIVKKALKIIRRYNYLNFKMEKNTLFDMVATLFIDV